MRCRRSLFEFPVQCLQGPGKAPDDVNAALFSVYVDHAMAPIRREGNKAMLFSIDLQVFITILHYTHKTYTRNSLS